MIIVPESFLIKMENQNILTDGIEFGEKESGGN